MWNEFSDFEIAELAYQYGFGDEIEFNSDLRLFNRKQLETMLTLREHNMAFGE